MSVRVAHEHSGEMGAIRADVNIVERADDWEPLMVSISFEKSVEGMISQPEMGGLTMMWRYGVEGMWRRKKGKCRGWG